MKARKTLLRALTAALASAALAWPLLGGATDAAGQAAGLQTVADEGPGYAIEDFAYPNADRILTEQKITLKRGNGRILLADCSAASDLLEVWGRKNERICFRVTGDRGYLALEIPAVYAVKGHDFTTQLDMRAGTEETTYEAERNTWTPVGESADEQGRSFMLMEIRTSS
ncbi:hypothetical protein ACQKM2_22205 [Streptomyces sp. NPDC004126]|uniref:hypothetical protein n=1 Tax=Streptomyces sp. NPDC004126 TaxID=3390695 RepID=UPI003D06880B